METTAVIRGVHISAQKTRLVADLIRTADEPAPVDHKYELGARIRGIWVTPAMMAPFVQTSSGMSSMSGGAEFVYHRASYDVVTLLDLSFINVQDGNFLGVNHNADVDTHY